MTIQDSLKKIISTAENFRDLMETSYEPTTISGTKFFDYHTGIKKNYLFNGDFQFPFTIGGLNFISGKKNTFFHCFQFVPSAKIRIFNNDSKYKDKSKPVRTPSFYPKLYYYISNSKFYNQDKKYFLGFGMGHHSNGQDGTEFVDYTDTVNIYNGSFSESLIHYFQIGGSFSKEINKVDSLAMDLIPGKIFTSKSPTKLINFIWKIGYEYHPPYFANQKFLKTGIYGGNRAFGNVQWIISRDFLSLMRDVKRDNIIYQIENLEKETGRLSFNFEYITDLTFNSGGFNHLQKIKFFNVQKRANVVLTYYKRILNSQFPAVFAQIAYYGSDNYNIYFQKSTFQARIGLAFGFFTYKKYGS